MIVRIFTTQREVAFQYGIAENEFRCPEVVGTCGVAFDGALGGTVIHRTIQIVAHRCHRLVGAAFVVVVIEESVEIEINTQLPHLSIIIGVEDVLAEIINLLD